MHSWMQVSLTAAASKQGGWKLHARASTAVWLAFCRLCDVAPE